MLYRMRLHNEHRLSQAAKGVHPIQPFEGSRPWEGNYANSIRVMLWGGLCEEVEALYKSKAG